MISGFQQTVSRGRSRQLFLLQYVVRSSDEMWQMCFGIGIGIGNWQDDEIGVERIVVFVFRLKQWRVWRFYGPPHPRNELLSFA